MLDILPALGAEAAADVARDHPHLALGHLEDVLRQHVAHAMGILHVGIEGHAILARIVGAERAARLHVLGVHPRDHVAPLDDPGGALDRLVGGGLVAALDEVGDVVGAVVPHRGRAGLHRVGGRGHRGQRLVVDTDQLGRVLGLGQRVGDHHRHRIADIAHPVGDQRRPLRGVHRLTVGALARHVGLGHAEPVGHDVVAGVDRQHARRLPGRLDVDRPDIGVGVRRPHEDRVGLAVQVDVIDVAPLPAQQARILEPQDRLTDTVLAHDAFSPGTASLYDWLTTWASGRQRVMSASIRARNSAGVLTRVSLPNSSSLLLTSGRAIA